MKLNKKFLIAAAALLMLISMLSGCGIDFGDLIETDISGTNVSDLSSVPEYSGQAYISVNNNVPFFSEDEITDKSYEYYSDLDMLGRCGAAEASVGQDIMPTEKRGSISSVKPTGWQTAKYDFVDGKYLYNRCHLLGFQLTGENANDKNLITGTRYLNIEGMLPFENMIADYVKETDNHVMYRVTPVFTGDNLVADGVLMEGFSVEDSGEGICFCVYAYNAQPGVTIDYATGNSWLSDDSNENPGASSEQKYVINENSKKFHYPDCSSVDKIDENAKKIYTGSRDDLINDGYSPCKNCNP